VTNPFDWRGPEFLGFYLILMGVVLLGGWWIRLAMEGGPVPRLTAIDPYVIAYLRGGTPEAIRTATLALVDRGLLKAEGPTVTATGEAASVKRALEGAILELCQGGLQVATTLFTDPRVLGACEPLRDELRNRKLMPDQGQILRRGVVAGVMLLVLGGTAIAKIQIALERGHTNVGFLFVLALAAAVITIKIFRKQRTALGDRVIADLKELFAGLRGRADDLRPGGATNEVAMLIGIFGIGALTGQLYGDAAGLFPKATAIAGGGSSSCGSSCGSGGGDGGGGCGGGGCGGCGGCGG
jgi:uncharacterized protein (TIGR04222 family)